jgi:hypothetical protein
MNITGANTSDLLRTCLASEYAFEIVCEDRLIRIAHYKGMWFFAKIKDKMCIDYCRIGDQYSGIETDSDASRGLYQQMSPGDTGVIPRYEEAGFLVRFLEIWMGTKNVASINVLQAFRNSSLDDQGTFTFAPFSNK